MFTKEKIKPENSLLQTRKMSTLEKNEKDRVERRKLDKRASDRQVKVRKPRP